MPNVIALLFAAALVAQAPAALPPAASPGDVAYRSGDFDRAASDYAAAVAANPNDPNAVLGLGTMDLYKNDLAGARTYLERAATLLPKDPAVRARLRTLAQRMPHAGDFQMAMLGNEVHIPFVETDPLPIVRAKIDGHDALFLLDTGGSNVDVTPDMVSRLHLKTTVAGKGVFAGGRSAQIRSTRISSMTFPNLTVRGIDSSVMPGPIEMGGHKLDGVIGTVFLAHFLSSLDYVHGQLTLRPRGAGTAFEARARAAHATIVPMWLVGDHFIFARAHAGDAPDALFNIDTGGGGLGVQLTKTQLEAAKIAPDLSKAQSFGGGGGAARAVPFTAPSVSLGSLTERNVPGLYFPDGDQYGIFPFSVGGTISHVFFRSTVLTFDFDAMALILTKD